MCGIGGISSTVAQSAEFWLRNANILVAGLAHRGPDDEGYLLLSNKSAPIPVGHKIYPSERVNYLPKQHLVESLSLSINGILMHKRLSIIGLGHLGHQPICDPSGRYWLTYNGEIFNYLELQSQFGLTNNSNTDSEILVQLWALKQEKCLSLLDGFFAFCVYDSLENSYTVVRDRTGVKPLFYSKTNEIFAFASEEQPLRFILGQNELNNKAVFAHLKHGMTDVYPWFKNIQTLTAGHLIKWFPNSREFKVSQWYYPERNILQNNSSLREMLLESMKIRLRSDVRLGFAVSGGIDSAVLVGIARHLLGNDAELDLFSVASNNLPGNESSWQKMVVEKNGGNHHNIWVETFNADLLPKMISYTNRAPVAWNNLAHFALCERVRQTGVTVLFNGQGADELFGGYPDYFIQTLFSERKQLAKFQKNWPIAYKDALKFFLKRKLRNALSDSQKQKIEKSVWGNKVTANLLEDPLMMLHPKLNGVEEMMLGDYYGSLQGDQFYGKLHQMLAWEDRNGMAFQLESRNPFADDLHIPQKYLGNFKLHELMEGGLPKGILRNAFKDLLPSDLYARTDKKGFSVPETWLTQKHGMSWKDALMYEGLDGFVKRDYRNKLLQHFSALNHKELQHYFRIASLGYFKLELDNERK